MEKRNPFEYEQATKLTSREMISYYIDDHNYSRFISSKKNVFLVGERGTGKTMTLLYYSLPTRIEYSKDNDMELGLEVLSVYVPCNTPLYHRREHEILDGLSAGLIGEHIFVCTIMQAMIEAVFKITNIATDEELKNFRSDFEYLYDVEFGDGISVDRAVWLFLNDTMRRVQYVLEEKAVNYSGVYYSFNSGVKPLISCLRRFEKISSAHFSFMIDDAQLLNDYQVKALNSWVSYRDNSLFSFKVATTRVDAPHKKTSSGGSILEGHDYIKIEMEQPYQNKTSEFAKLANKIIEKRLTAIGISKTPEDFFPVNKAFLKVLEEAKEAAKREYELKKPDSSGRSVRDYVYKYARAIYFRDRASHANLPQYSGFDLLVHLSSGVIRNLLIPCYVMYDTVLSQNKHYEYIPTSIQSQVIIQKSKDLWRLAETLDSAIEGCSQKDRLHVYQMLDKLAILFKKRLMSDISEPRAVDFTISGLEEERHAELINILKIAQKAQLLYTYRSSAKDAGKMETYYMTNRMLLPERGLDPFGQHARVSIKADLLLQAAIDNKELPYNKENGYDDESKQGFLFEQ
jgi:hypothetical protein